MPIRITLSPGLDDFKGVTATTPASASVGDRYIDSDDDTMYVYYGGTWQAIHTLTPAAPAPIIAGAPIGLLMALTYPTDTG